MVPDLHKLKSEIDGDYWRNWVTNGKPGTLMPGFAATEGGPLDDADIKSLVEYLTKAFPRPMKTPPASAARGPTFVNEIFGIVAFPNWLLFVPIRSPASRLSASDILGA